MQKLFNKVLVPVDFSATSKSAIDKAIDIAKQYNCSIHLLHVVSVSRFAAVSMPSGYSPIPYTAIDNKKELEYRLKKLTDYVFLHTDGKIIVDYSVIVGTRNYAIIELAKQESFDLVLIAQRGRFFGKRKMKLNPDLIAKRTNIPVMTVPSNRGLTKLCSIVIPVTDFLPVRKLMYGIYIASNYSTTVTLLGIENRGTLEKVEHYLKKAYHLIHDNSGVSVGMEIVASENVAEAVNEFAMFNSADLIIVNPGAQSKMPGLFSTLLGNILQKYSVPPVLTVNSP